MFKDETGEIVPAIVEEELWDQANAVLKKRSEDVKNRQGIVNKEFVDKYIDKIFVPPEEDGAMRLQIKIFTGETTDKYLTNHKRRTGHTFKNVCPVRTASFSRENRTAVGHEFLA